MASIFIKSIYFIKVAPYGFFNIRKPLSFDMKSSLPFANFRKFCHIFILDKSKHAGPGLLPGIDVLELSS